MISGFVIAYSLSRSTSIVDFAARRYARLLPAMIVCALISTICAHLLPFSMYIPEMRDSIPSIVFIEPEILNKLHLMNEIQSVDGSYWSLYVEVKFYAIIGVAYFSLGRRMIIVLCCLSASIVTAYCTIGSLSGLAGTLLFAQWWPWFVTVRQILSSRLLAIIGLASYPLYLLHQNLGVQAIRLIAALLPTARWSGWLPIVVSGLMICVSIAIYMFVERPTQRMLSKPLRRLSALTALRRLKSATPV